MLKTHISWADSTHNFWTGCTKVSAGCKNCYLYRMFLQQGKDPSVVTKASDASFDTPTRWKSGKVIFTCSMSDFFHQDADQWRDEAWDVIRSCPQHLWLILTKRPERIINHLPADWLTNFDHVALGTTVEDNKSFHRMEELAKVPGTFKFISAEPLLEYVDLMKLDASGNRPIDAFQWLILGGESGNPTGQYQARPCNIGWLEQMIEDVDTQAPHVYIEVKQMGNVLASKLGLPGRGDDQNLFPPFLRRFNRPAPPVITAPAMVV
jgi:protein gp37